MKRKDDLDGFFVPNNPKLGIYPFIATRIQSTEEYQERIRRKASLKNLRDERKEWCVLDN